MTIPPSFDPKEAEDTWYHFWEKEGFFLADPLSKKEPYCIVIPPPNVTGVLHMGHALVNTIQDVLIRWKRMCGYETLWVPGTDHAGIATQSVVERHLLATSGKRRHDYGREEFVNIVWEWKETYEKRIIGQLKKLGASCDWSRQRFTMDEGCNKAVKTLFKKLYDDGLIYRGNYLVNWDPKLKTALADDEVEYEEHSSFLWYFKYPLKDSQEFVTIATTRPETMLGDVAVAVSPKDKRYAPFHGKKVVLPLMEREIPIIVDPYVDPEFGTGVVKITPAHDPNDYEMALRHNLPMINIFTPECHINENGGEFQGLPREEARKAVVAEMKKRGLLVKVEPHALRVGVSYRSKAIIEPYLSQQWFVKMTPFKEMLKKVVQDKEVRVIPPLWETTFFHWIDHLRDWCISRQLWWGHRIPIWHNKKTGETLCYIGEGAPKEVEKEPDLWEQDSDVLDTWFSSSLWPFSTLGWPEKTDDLEKFYPNSTLITGHDILFFWVARMIFMGKYALKQAPFPEVFLHGLIYGKSYWKVNERGEIAYITGEEKKKYDLGAPLPKDVHSKWEKLSKSKGNAIDPLELIDEYGTDALRMTLTACANQSPQIDLDRRKFEEFKNFANKIWNGARFIFMNLEGLTQEELKKGLNLTLLTLEDRWILSRMNRVNKEVNAALENYEFEKAASRSYDFFWKELCANYLEIVKPVLFGKIGNLDEKINKQKLLTIILVNAISLLHPMAPFITEELFQRLKTLFSGSDDNKSDPYTQKALLTLSKKAVIIAPYPTTIVEQDIDAKIEEDFALVEEVVHALRKVRGEMKIPPHMGIDLYIIDKNNTLQNHLPIISALVKITTLTIVEKAPPLSLFAQAAINDITLIVPLPEELAAQEKERLKKEKEKLTQKIEQLERQLADENFQSRAKPEVIQKQKETLAKLHLELTTLNTKETS